MLGGFGARWAHRRSAFVPAAMAQWLPPPWGAAFPGEIERSLEARGYVLKAPLIRRPGVYLADVSAGPAGYQRLIIDARSGQILERFAAPGRMWGPVLAVSRRRVWRVPPPGVGGPPLGGTFSNPPGDLPGEICLRRFRRTCISRGHQPVRARGGARSVRSPSQRSLRPNAKFRGQGAAHQSASAASRPTRSGQGGRTGPANVQPGGERGFGPAPRRISSGRSRERFTNRRARDARLFH